MAQSRRCRGQRRQRSQHGGRTGRVGDDRHHRQHDLALGGDGAGEPTVAGGVVGGLREQDVVADALHAGAGQRLDQLGVACARPWPAAQCLQAGVVDRHDGDVARAVGQPVALPGRDDLLGEQVMQRQVDAFAQRLTGSKKYQCQHQRSSPGQGSQPPGQILMGRGERMGRQGCQSSGGAGARSNDREEAQSLVLPSAPRDRMRTW